MLHMAKDEIVVRYRQAKDQNEQVKILAQLNDCPVSEILSILTRAGEITGESRAPEKSENKLAQNPDFVRKRSARLTER